MNILVTYDVNTESPTGQRRLRHVATACKNYGQRVQFSVFECRVNEAQYEALRSQLVSIIDPKLIACGL
ncbi:MAG: CRISPR-associated endonuclease Cas2 [Leptolyngbyaceae cyanobacterium SM1_3_5]|nr:CRISPR-associated endonuclease Cas2 [Leptolyngbyaceae cyanobacterium SM1_3_5]